MHITKMSKLVTVFWFLIFFNKYENNYRLPDKLYLKTKSISILHKAFSFVGEDQYRLSLLFNPFFKHKQF